MWTLGCAGARLAGLVNSRHRPEMIFVSPKALRLVLQSIRAIAVLMVLLSANVALAQTPAWPAKPIKIIVAYPPSGTTDIAGRLLAERLSAGLGLQVVSRIAPVPAA